MKFIRFLPAVIYLVALLLLLADSFGSNSKVYRYFDMHSYWIALYAIALLVCLRLFTALPLLASVRTCNTKFVLPASLLLGIGLTLWDVGSTPNYVYSLTKLHQTQIVFLSLLSLVVFLYSQTNKWFANNLYLLIFSSTFVLLGYLSLTALLPFEVFSILSHEDGVVEYLQFVVLLGGAFFALKTALSLRKQGITVHAWLFFMIFLVLVGVAGDEISWGQRLLSIGTPEAIETHNVQDEITIHNLSFVHQFVNIGYILVGFYGAFAWVFVRVSKKHKQSVHYYVPHWSCSAYYAFGFMYNLFVRVNSDHTIGKWAEPAELMLYTGIMLTLLIVFCRLHKNLRSER